MRKMFFFSTEGVSYCRFEHEKRAVALESQNSNATAPFLDPRRPPWVLFGVMESQDGDGLDPVTSIEAA